MRGVRSHTRRPSPARGSPSKRSRATPPLRSGVPAPARPETASETRRPSPGSWPTSATDPPAPRNAESTRSGAVPGASHEHASGSGPPSASRRISAVSRARTSGLERIRSISGSRSARPRAARANSRCPSRVSLRAASPPRAASGSASPCRTTWTSIAGNLHATAPACAVHGRTGKIRPHEEARAGPAALLDRIPAFGVDPPGAQDRKSVV